MTRERAIQILNCHGACWENGESIPASAVSEAVQMAVKALEEKEPVEPVLLREGWNIQHNDYRCPICKNDLYYEQAFCDECGKPVKWE